MNEERWPGLKRNDISSEQILRAQGTHVIELRLLDETYQLVLNVLDGYSGSPEEGLLHIFLTGLYASLDDAAVVDQRDQGSGTGQEGQARSVEEMRLNAMYMAMKHHAFTLLQDNQTLRFNISGLRAANELANKRVEIRRQEEDRLMKENETLLEENNGLRLRLGLPARPAGTGEIAGMGKSDTPGPNEGRRVRGIFKRRSTKYLKDEGTNGEQ